MTTARHKTVQELLTGGANADPLDMITDWYLPETGYKDGFFYPGAVSISGHPSLYETASRLLEESRKKAGLKRRAMGLTPALPQPPASTLPGVPETNSEYAEFVLKDGHRTYRGHRIDTVGGSFFALRRLPDVIPDLNILGMPMGIVNILLHSSLRSGGLIIVCGETGQGKSTTCAAVVRERMIRHNSFCLTVEDPPEMPLHGTHGGGRCLQTEVMSGSFADAMRGAMRCYPTIRGSMLYVGETRDQETAAEVLRIATNGHLVLTTLHANDLLSAISRFSALATAKMGESEVRSVFSSSLRLVLHQRLEVPRRQKQKEAVARRKLMVQFLLSHDHSSPVASAIRRGELESLPNQVDLQRRTMENKGVDALMELWSFDG